MPSRTPEESAAPARSTLLLPPPEPPWSACRLIRRRRRASLAPREAASSPFSSVPSSSWRSPAASGSGAPPHRAGASRTAPSPPRPLPLRVPLRSPRTPSPPRPAPSPRRLSRSRRRACPQRRRRSSAAAPAPVAIPAAPTAKRVNVVLMGALEESIPRALPLEDRRIADQLTQVVNRLLVWDLQVARDGRKGDRLEVAVHAVRAGRPRSAAERRSRWSRRSATSRRSSGRRSRVYRFQPEGARWPRYYREDATELEEHLVDAPIGGLRADHLAPARRPPAQGRRLQGAGRLAGARAVRRRGPAPELELPRER